MYVEKIPVKNKKKEVGIIAAYCRISKNVVEQQSSLNTQIAYFKELSNKVKEIDLVEVYYDVGRSELRRMEEQAIKNDRRWIGRQV